jgi:hypothetical protein
MEILAGLIRLDRPGFLPAPWFNRPSLGLVTNTPVRVGVLKAAGPISGPPDIIVTPLRTDRLHCTASVIIDLKERAGAVYEALNRVSTVFNIALAETVTIDQRTRHRITLILEPTDYYSTSSRVGISEYKEHLLELKKDIEQIGGYINFTSNFVVDDTTRFEKQDTSVVVHGAINFKTISDWFEGKYSKEFGDRFDFTRVVVSSSADGRFIRYIFPKKGVFEATVSHLDVPSALAKISNVFQVLEHNILLSRLSRSVPSQNKSIYVAICEPLHPLHPNTQPGQYAIDTAANITKALNASDPDYQFVLERGEVSLGAGMDTVAYPYRHGMNPASREIRAPYEIRSYLNQYKLVRQNSIFISYRGALKHSPAGLALWDEIIKRIRQSGAKPYDGFSLPNPLHEDDAADVRARMWMASAVIFFAYCQDQIGNFSDNQLIEWGYNYGQGKPWVVIAKEGQESNVMRFMTPSRSFITFKHIETPQAIEELGNKVSNAIVRWFQPA